MNIFDYSDYRKFVNDSIRAEAKSGARSRLARAANCSPSWMTRALSGQVQLTPDQGLGVAQYFHLSDDETDYFLLLVEFERAATPLLKKRIQTKLNKLHKGSRTLASAVKTDSAVSESDSARYYTSWIYSAAHVACMIQPYAMDELASLLKVSERALKEILAELKQMGLLLNKLGKWQATSKNVHLSAGSAMSVVGHSNWRNHAIQHLREGTTDDLHYSAIHCLSKDDKERVRRKLKDAVLDCRKIIENSASEELAVFCLDWYGP